MNVIPFRYETLPPNTTSVLGSRVLALLQSSDEENEVKELNGKKQLAKNLWILEVRLTLCVLHLNLIFLGHYSRSKRHHKS